MKTILLSLLLTLTLHAVPVIYTDRASWEAAVGQTVMEDFNGVTPETCVAGRNDFGALGFMVTGDPIHNFSGLPKGQITESGLIDGSHEFRARLGFAWDTAFVFDEPITAFAADWWGTSGTGGSVGDRERAKLQINDAILSFVGYLPGGTAGFLGIVDTDPFTSIALRGLGDASGSTWGLDNAQWAVSSVPDGGSTLLLLAIASVPLLLGLKRCGRYPEPYRHC
jgi:hypothetical protein